MTETLHSNKRLAKNTLYLYFRTFFVMLITIFTSRIVLDSLGIENYGIYNIVGGFVSMFSILSGTLTAASQRFIAFELGNGNSNIRKVFSTIFTIHILLAIIIFILLESIGLWFLNYKINISPDNSIAANCVFQCSVLTFCINIISIPYNAVIIAYEKMSVYAYISIFEVIAKLVVAYILYIVSFDVLIAYAILMLFVAIILRLIYRWYCTKTFNECRYSLLFDKDLTKKMLGFCGWNFIGSTAAVLNGQGINLLINLFFGVAYNAARGIAIQVESALNAFVQNFMMALNPQLTKAYAAGDFSYVNKVLYFGTKYVFYLFLVLCLPVFFNIEFILSLWLKQVPDKAALFIKYGIIFSLCQSLSQCLYIIMLATGNIKRYQIIVGALSIMAFPTTYLFYTLGYPCEYGYISTIIFSIICFFVRLFLLKDTIPYFSISMFIYKALLPIFFSLLPIITVLYYLHTIISINNILILVIDITLSISLSLVFIFLIGFGKTERLYIKTYIFNKITQKK